MFDELLLALNRLANAAESLSAHAKHPDDEGHRFWFRSAIGDVDREVRLARAVLAKPLRDAILALPHDEHERFVAALDRIAAEKAVSVTDLTLSSVGNDR